MRGGAAGAQKGGLKRGLGENEIQERSVVRLDEEEEDLLERNVKQRGASNDVAGIAPDAVANQIRVPREGCEHGDLALSTERLHCYSASTYGHQENDLEGIELGEERAVQQRKQHSGRDGVLDMASRISSVAVLSRSVSVALLSRTQSHSQSP